MKPVCEEQKVAFRIVKYARLNLLRLFEKFSVVD